MLRSKNGHRITPTMKKCLQGMDRGQYNGWSLRTLRALDEAGLLTPGGYPNGQGLVIARAAGKAH